MEAMWNRRTPDSRASADGQRSGVRARLPIGLAVDRALAWLETVEDLLPEAALEPLAGAPTEEGARMMAALSGATHPRAVCRPEPAPWSVAPSGCRSLRRLGVRVVGRGRRGRAALREPFV